MRIALAILLVAVSAFQAAGVQAVRPVSRLAAMRLQLAGARGLHRNLSLSPLKAPALMNALNREFMSSSESDDRKNGLALLEALTDQRGASLIPSVETDEDTLHRRALLSELARWQPVISNVRGQPGSERIMASALAMARSLAAEKAGVAVAEQARAMGLEPVAPRLIVPGLKYAKFIRGSLEREGTRLQKVPSSILAATGVDLSRARRIVLFTLSPFLGDNIVLQYGSIDFLHRSYPQAEIHVISPTSDVLRETEWLKPHVAPVREFMNPGFPSKFIDDPLLVSRTIKASFEEVIQKGSAVIWNDDLWHTFGNYVGFFLQQNMGEADIQRWCERPSNNGKTWGRVGSQLSNIRSSFETLVRDSGFVRPGTSVDWRAG